MNGVFPAILRWPRVLVDGIDSSLSRNSPKASDPHLETGASGLDVRHICASPRRRTGGAQKELAPHPRRSIASGAGWFWELGAVAAKLSCSGKPWRLARRRQCYLAGKRGTGFIPTMTETKIVPAGNAAPPPPIPAPVRGRGSLTNVCNCPIEESALLKVETKALSESGPRTWTPSSNPPVTTSEALSSNTLSLPNTDRNNIMICAPNAAPSPSSP